MDEYDDLDIPRLLKTYIKMRQTTFTTSRHILTSTLSFACLVLIFENSIIMSRPTHSPAKLPTFPARQTDSLATQSGRSAEVPPPVPKFLTKTNKHQTHLDAPMEGAVKQITDSLSNLDFNKFFFHFREHTPVYQFLMEFDLEEFKYLLSRAFPGKAPRSSDKQGVVDTMNAKEFLDENLNALDCMFKRMQDKGLDVGNIRASLAWVRNRNNETYDRLPQADTQWFGRQHLDVPGASSSFVANDNPDEVTTLHFPLRTSNPSTAANYYDKLRKTSSNGTRPLAENNTGNRETRHHDSASSQGTDERPRNVTYIRYRPRGGVSFPNPSHPPSPSRGSNHSQAHYDTPPPPYQLLPPPPSPSRRHESHSSSSGAPHSHPHNPFSHLDYEEDDPNLPFIPFPPSKSRRTQRIL